MTTSDLADFRRRCCAFRLASRIMVLGAGALVLSMQVMTPSIARLRDGVSNGTFPVSYTVLALPLIFYLYAVWTVGTAIGRLGDGDGFQPTLSRALQGVGMALFLGGATSVLLVHNLLRWLGYAQGGFLHFDVPGMTLGMIGAALFLLGRVIADAVRLEDELKATSARFNAVKAELDEMI